MPAGPGSGQAWTKALVVLLLVGEVLLGAWLALWGIFSDEASDAELIAFAVFCAAIPFALVGLLARRRGRWRVTRALRRASLAVVLVIQVVAIVKFSTEGFWSLRNLGLSADDIAWTLVAVAAGFIALGACFQILSANPGSNGRPVGLPRLRPLSRSLMMLGAAIGLLGVVLGASGWERPGCEGFRFDRDRWSSRQNKDDALFVVTDREEMADTLARCRLLRGKSESQVREMLGSGADRGKHRLDYDIDWTGFLQIDFVPETGRVSRATVIHGSAD